MFDNKDLILLIESQAEMQAKKLAININDWSRNKRVPDLQAAISGALGILILLQEVNKLKG